MKKKKNIQREKERHDYALFENLLQKIELQFTKGWLAIAKLKPLSFFISLLSMPKKAFDNVDKIAKGAEFHIHFVCIHICERAG